MALQKATPKRRNKVSRFFYFVLLIIISFSLCSTRTQRLLYANIRLIAIFVAVGAHVAALRVAHNAALHQNAQEEREKEHQRREHKHKAKEPRVARIEASPLALPAAVEGEHREACQ